VQNTPSSLRGLPAAIVFACCLTLTQTIHAQDALQAAVAADAAYRARTSEEAFLPGNVIQAGPVQLQAYLTYGLEWNDNIYLRPTNRQDDFIHRPQFNLMALWPVTDTSRLSFGAGIGYEVYMDHSDLDGLLITPNSEFAWDIRVKDFVFTVSDRFNYSQDVISQGTIGGGTAQFPRIENTAGLRMRWHPSQYVFELGYSHYNFFAASGGGTNFDYLERSAELLLARAGWRLGEVTTLGLETTASFTDYAATLQSDNRSVSVGPYLDWQVTPTLNLSLRGGKVFYSFDPNLSRPASEDFNSYYVGLEARHQLTDHIRQQLSLTREVQQGLNQGSDYIEQLHAGYLADWDFHRSAALGVNFFYENFNEPQGGVDEKSDRYGAGVALTVRPLDHFQASVRYRFTTRDSDLPDNNYDQNSVSLNLSYGF
jgi:hypothetical protein